MPTAQVGTTTAYWLLPLLGLKSTARAGGKFANRARRSDRISVKVSTATHTLITAEDTVGDNAVLPRLLKPLRRNKMERIQC